MDDGVRVFSPAEILLPRGCEMTKWSVVACDQHTSEPEYWDRVERFVGEAPSTYNMMLPEHRYREAGFPERAAAVRRHMREYLDGGRFRAYPNSYVYIERRLANGAVRRGLMGKLDLEQYDSAPKAKTLIRSTEGVVPDKLPARILLREGAPLEMSHVMVFVDDPKETLIEPLTGQKDSFEPLYDFPLMEGGGHIRGWRLSAPAAAGVEAAIDRLLNAESFSRRYDAEGESVLIFAIGDGNHSLSSAKACWEKLKPTLSPAQRRTHPARFALVELVNIMDEAETFEPIHRVLFELDPETVLRAVLNGMEGAVPGEGEGPQLRWLYAGREGIITLTKPKSPLAVGDFTAFIDAFLAQNGGRIDYVHEERVCRELAQKPGTISFLMPELDKTRFFRSIIKGGALPRKTFSMGHSEDKRYYLECRRITE